MSVITKDLGVATAYGYAKSKGYTGTEEEFAELMASYADVAQQAEASAQDAEDAKDEAVTAKTDAQTAKTAAQAAQSAAETASGTASAKASEAAQSAQNAAGSASAAQTSATAASGSAQTAQTAAQTATNKASEASSSASAASTAKTGAETARTGAQTAQTAAETAQANAEAAASSVSASAAQIEQNTEEIGAIKNDLSELSSAYSAFVVETETGSIASFTDGADNVPVKDLTVAIEPVQSGSGDPSPENIRPISGWTGANVTRTGKNWLDKTLLSDISAYDDLASGYYYTEPITLAPNTQYVMSPSSTSSLGVSDYYVLYINPSDSDPDYLVITNQAIKYPVEEGLPKTVTFTTGATGTIRLGVVMVSGGPKQSALTAFMSINYQLELGSTATAYEPYQGETYEVDWTTEAGTVYGGTLDVTTGVLTVDTARIALSSLNFDVVNTHYFYSGITGIAYNSLQIWSDTYKTTGPYNGYNESNFDNCTIAISQSQARIAIRDDSYSDVASFVASLTDNDKYIVYGLSEPQTYQLTPQEVSTILGQNNIFADCGNVTVQYRADTKLYIDKVLNA